MSTDQTNVKNLAVFWTDFYREEFKNETDRGAVILAASLLENALTNILKKYFVPTPTDKDELFDSYGPLSTFSSKI